MCAGFMCLPYHSADEKSTSKSLVGPIRILRTLTGPWGKSAHRQQLPIEEKESYRWLRIQDQIAAHVPDDVNFSTPSGNMTHAIAPW